MGVCGGPFTFIVINGLSEKFVYEVRVIIGAHGEPMKRMFFCVSQCRIPSVEFVCAKERDLCRRSLGFVISKRKLYGRIVGVHSQARG